MYPIILAGWRQHDVTSIPKWRWTGAILIASDLASSLLLSSKDRVSSFYGTRGRKHCFFTSFSYLNLYFLILVFFAQLLLTSFCAPFSAARKSNFLSRFLIPLAIQGSTLYLRPHVSGTERIVFLKQDATKTLVLDSVPIFFPISAFHAFCQRFLVQTSVGRSLIIPFFLTKILKLALSRVT